MIYIVIFVICLYFACHYDLAYAGNYREKKSAKAAYVLIGVIFILFAGLRSEFIGGDTMNYYNDFFETPEYKDLDSSVFATSRYQPLWVSYVALIKSLGGTFTVQLLVEAIFVNAVILRFFWNYTKVPFLCALIFYISPNFIEFNTEIMREAFSISLCLLAFEGYIKKKYIVAFILWLLAYNIHVSAMIGLFFPLFAMIKYNRNVLIGAMVFCAFALGLFPMISEYSTEIQMFMASISAKFVNLYDFYSSQIGEERNTNYFILLIGTKLVLPLLMICYLKKGSNNVFGFVLVYMIMHLLASYTEAFYRFANYEAIFFIILVAQFLHAFYHKTCDTPILRIIFFVLALVVLLYIFQAPMLIEELGQSNLRYERYIPYKFFFESPY